VQEIENVLWQHRANFLFECSYRQESKERDIIAFFSRQAVDGLIISSVIDPNSILSQVQQSQIPAVFLSQRFEQYDVDYVINDNYEGGLVATEHLLHLGHTRIAYIADFDSQSSAHERFLFSLQRRKFIDNVVVCDR
jgi:LacI family transcriptional regulator